MSHNRPDTPAEKEDAPQHEDIPIVRLGLSARSYNFLTRQGYSYVSELIGVTKADLLAINNIGDVSASEIIEKMKSISSGLKINTKKMTIMEYANSISHDRDRILFIKRLQGVTFEEIGKSVGMSKERIRQITLKYLTSRLDVV